MRGAAVRPRRAHDAGAATRSFDVPAIQTCRAARSNGCAGRHHTGLRLARRITLAHFSVSSAMSLANSAGAIGMGAPPRSANRAFILGSARPALTSLWILSMTSTGVPLGTPTPYQALV